jgi:hypothetical protein
MRSKATFTVTAPGGDVVPLAGFMNLSNAAAHAITRTVTVNSRMTDSGSGVS